MSGPGDAPASEARWPAESARPIAFLLDVASPLEERILREWIEAARPADVASQSLRTHLIPSSRRPGSRRYGQGVAAELDSQLAAPEDYLLAPLRVLWLPAARDGERVAGFRDLLRLGDPRDPGRLRARWISRFARDRMKVVAAEPAPVSNLRDRWRVSAGKYVAETLGLGHFVAKQAALALDRAERKVRGARYKVPRFVHEEILARPSFLGGLDTLARAENRDAKSVRRTAARYLREIAAKHNPFMIDLFAQLCRSSSTRAYDSLNFDAAKLEEIRQLAQQHPVAFMPTHKSNLDHMVMFRTLHEDGMPPNHTAGGINMNFFPLGPIARRAGIFFIRRTFSDNEVYKFVLRSYIDFLIEKRFPLEWFIEGGRSRSGKMLPPRYGLLSYVVDSYRRGKSEDVILIPVSIAYDQISEVGDYSQEDRGGEKQTESFSWFLKFIGRLGRQYGNIDLSFGEPFSLRTALGPPDGDAAPLDPIVVPKIAFEVCARINRATPITPISLGMLALLGRGNRAMSLLEIKFALQNLAAFVERRGLPTTAKLDFETLDAIESTLRPLVATGVLVRFDEGPEVIYSIADGQHLSAAYYRNTVIHFLVNSALVEIALVRASETVDGDSSEDCVDAFWSEAMRIRDLLKFDFFFSEKEQFRQEIEAELALHSDRWQEQICDPKKTRELLDQIRPFHAHRTLRAFVDAYQVVADRLYMLGDEPVEDSKKMVRDCMAWGKQYTLQRRIRSPESVSKILLENGFKLAENRGLLTGDPARLAEERTAFVAELRETIRRIRVIDALAAQRLAGAVDYRVQASVKPA